MLRLIDFKHRSLWSTGLNALQLVVLVAYSESHYESVAASCVFRSESWYGQSRYGSIFVVWSARFDNVYLVSLSWRKQ